MYIGRYLRIIASAAVLTAAAGIANATTFNTSLVDPPGFYNGTGSPNVGFTTNTVGGIEFGLSTVLRHVGPVTPVGDVYNVQTGLNPTNTSARWNFQYSINLQVGGANPSLHLIDIVPTVSILNVGNGNIFSFNPFVTTPDNAGWGNSGENFAILNMSSDYGFQNSQNLSFGFVPLLFGFNPFVDNTFVITLSATRNGELLGSVSETTIVGVGAVPLPGALPLFATALGAMGLLGWRRKRKAAAAV